MPRFACRMVLNVLRQLLVLYRFGIMCGKLAWLPVYRFVRRQFELLDSARAIYKRSSSLGPGATRRRIHGGPAAGRIVLHVLSARNMHPARATAMKPVWYNEACVIQWIFVENGLLYHTDTCTTADWKGCFRAHGPVSIKTTRTRI